jgi:hypothetical protein
MCGVPQLVVAVSLAGLAGLGSVRWAGADLRKADTRRLWSPARVASTTWRGSTPSRGDRGEVGAEAVTTEAGRNGHGLPGGDEFELVLDGLDEGAVGCPASVRSVLTSSRAQRR